MSRDTRTILGFDYGTQKIGIAVGQEITGTAAALTTLLSKNQRPDWAGISTLIEQWQPDLLIVGLPIQMDGSAQEMTQAATRFGHQLKGRYNLPVEWMDERLSSYEANSLIGEQRRGENKGSDKNKHTTDAVAAQLIVQSWLDHPEQAITDATKF